MSNYLIKRLITFLVNNNDLYLMFEACWVLINVAYVNKGGEMIAEDEDNLNNILKFIIRAKEDEDILHNALWLLKNLNSSSKKAKQFFFDNYILDFFEIIYDSYPTSDIIIDDILSHNEGMLDGVMFMGISPGVLGTKSFPDTVSRRLNIV